MHVPAVSLPGCGYLCVAQETEICVAVTMPGEVDPGVPPDHFCVAFQ